MSSINRAVSFGHLRERGLKLRDRVAPSSHRAWVQDLLGLHARYGAQYDHIHLGASWMAVSRLSRGRRMSQALLQDLEPLQSRTIDTTGAGGMDSQGLANVAYAVARAGMRGPAAAVSQLVRRGSLQSPLLKVPWTALALAARGHMHTHHFTYNRQQLLQRLSGEFTVLVYTADARLLLATKSG